MILVVVTGIFPAKASWVDVLSELHERAEAQVSELPATTFAIVSVSRDRFAGTKGTDQPVEYEYHATFEVR
jgi:hypothetical protein